MLPLPSLLSALILSLSSSTVFVAGAGRTNYRAACLAIQKVVSSSSIVSFPGSTLYDQDNLHYFNSSSQASACSVEPANVADLSKILVIVGNSSTPFGVKGGGHATNPGFSSTPGVLIAMTKFNKVVYNKRAGTADIGTGITWDTVYDTLVPQGANVVGGRVTGVGVPGFALGGGISWKSQQFGLTIDTMVSVEMVLPNGTFTTASASHNPDLFFAVRGGFNNFGIVTKITLRTHAQGMVWGGVINFAASQLSAFNTAVANFEANNTDPKAQLIAEYLWQGGEFSLAMFIFYDGPKPPAIYDEILSIPTTSSNAATRTFTEFIVSLGGLGNFAQGVVNTASVVKYTPPIIDTVANLTQYYASQAASHGATLILLSIEPFTPAIYAHTRGGAYPHVPSLPLHPLAIELNWADGSQSSYWQQAARDIASIVEAKVNAEGQRVQGQRDIRYPNYAIWDTPVENIYGANLQRLRDIRSVVDPGKLMDLTGGFRI